MSNKIVIFIHLPKTAGSTINYILESFYNKNNTITVQSTRGLEEIKDFYEIYQNNNIKLIKGHFTLDLTRNIDAEKYIFTFLRSPLSQFISEFKHVKQKSHNRFHQFVNDNNFTLLDYLYFNKSKNLDNPQTRHLSGAITHFEDEKSINPINFLEPGDPTVNFDLDGNEHIEIAKNFIQEGINQVFFTDEFDKSILQLTRDLKFKRYPYYNLQNKANYHESFEINEKFISEFKKIYKFDLELYEFAKQKFNTPNINLLRLNLFKLLNSIFKISKKFI